MAPQRGDGSAGGGARAPLQLERAASLDAAAVREQPLLDPAGYPDRAGLPEDKRHERVVEFLAWSLPMVLMLIVGLAGAGTPGLWGDELATWGAIRLDWPDLWMLLPQTDAALGPYYVALRGWAALVGDSDVLLRLPSVLAVAGAAALVGRLGTRLGGARVGLLAGLSLVALPVTSRYAQEARPYALAMLLAAASTVLLIRVLDRPGWARLLAYTACVVLLGLAHVLALALLAGHAFVVLALRPAVLGRWAPAALAGCVPAVPVAWWAYRQRDNIAWIASSDLQRPDVFAASMFGVPMAAGVVLALGVVALSARRPAVVFSAWALLPAAALLALGHLTVTVWLPRYLLFVVPAWILLAGLTLARAPLPAALAVVVLLGLSGLSQQAAIRRPDGHYLDSRGAGGIIAASSRPDDAVVYGHERETPWVPRDVVARYVPADRRPADVLAIHPQRVGGSLSAVECRDVAPCLGDAARLWIVRVNAHENPVAGLGARYEAPIRARYVVEQVWHPAGLTIALLARKRP